jgi:hypothetical protein
LGVVGQWKNQEGGDGRKSKFVIGETKKKRGRAGTPIIGMMQTTPAGAFNQRRTRLLEEKRSSQPTEPE